MPREVRELANISVGDTLLFVKEGEEVILRRIDKELLNKAFGLWKRAEEKTPLVNRLLRGEPKRRY